MTTTTKAAASILQQLDRHDFRTRTGAGNFEDGDHAVSFTLPRFAGVRKCQVLVTQSWREDGTYAVNFYRFTRHDDGFGSFLGGLDFVSRDSLRDVFTEASWLDKIKNARVALVVEARVIEAQKKGRSPKAQWWTLNPVND